MMQLAIGNSITNANVERNGMVVVQDVRRWGIFIRDNPELDPRDVGECDYQRGMGFAPMVMHRQGWSLSDPDVLKRLQGVNKKMVLVCLNDRLMVRKMILKSAIVLLRDLNGADTVVESEDSCLVIAVEIEGQVRPMARRRATNAKAAGTKTSDENAE